MKNILLFVCSTSFLLSDPGSDYLREEASLAKIALYSKCFLKKKPKATLDQKKELKERFKGKKELFPIPLKKLIKDLGYPSQTFIPPGSTGDTQAFIIWEYLVSGKSSGLLRYKISLDKNNPKEASAFGKIVIKK